MISKNRNHRRTSSPESDVALAQAAANGESSARRKLAGRLFDHVRATVFYLAAGHSEVEDCVQLALIEILKSTSTFRGDSSLEAWAERIAVRATLRYIKTRRWRSEIVTLVAEHDRPDEGSPEVEVLRGQISRRLTSILRSVQRKQQEVLILRLVLGYSIAEIAELTETNAHTVRYRLKSGRKELRAKLLEDGELIAWMRNK